MSERKSILMIASENDALPATKVGGIADVVRDTPQALADQNCEVKVVLPDYGHLTSDLSCECINYFSVNFRGRVERVALYKVQPKDGILVHEHISYWLISHPEFMPCGQGQIYCHDDSTRPFATDASKYAFFCAAVAQNIIQGGFGGIDVLHLHDWHSAFIAILREYDTRFSALKSLTTVYTIHNLALQGVRPFKGDPSSLEEWFPGLNYDARVICDPRFPHCLNPMRAGIELADKVHAVSPSYAQEIQSPSRVELGLYGGEGLELYLQKAHKEKRLFGILNGCEYPRKTTKKLTQSQLIELCHSVLIEWVCQSSVMSSFHWLAQQRLHTWKKKLRLTQWEKKNERVFLMTSIGRITEQKVRLLLAPVKVKGKFQTVLDHLLDLTADNGVFLMVGSGQQAYEEQLLRISGKRENFIFLCGYSDKISQVIYQSGDLFLMPSSFEPCGISQMLAMRAGQACLVHEVGGLKDTVIDGKTGFSFQGASIEAQAKALIAKYREVLRLHENESEAYNAIAKKAKAQRFSWSASAKQYLSKLYGGASG